MGGLAVQKALQALADSVSVFLDVLVRRVGPIGRWFGSEIRAAPLRYATLFFVPALVSFLALFPREVGVLLEANAGVTWLVSISPRAIAQGSVIVGVLFVCLLVLNALHIDAWWETRDAAIQKLEGSTLQERVAGIEPPGRLHDEVLFLALFLSGLFVFLFCILLDGTWNGDGPGDWNWLLSLKLLAYSLLSSLPIVGVFVDEATVGAPPLTELDASLTYWVTALQLFIQFAVFASAIAVFKNIVLLARTDDGGVRVVHDIFSASDQSPSNLLHDLARFDPKVLKNIVSDGDFAASLANADALLTEYASSVGDRRESLRASLTELLDRIRETGDSGGLAFCTRALTQFRDDLTLLEKAIHGLAAIRKTSSVRDLRVALVREQGRNALDVRRALAQAFGMFKTEGAALEALLTFLGKNGDGKAIVRRDALQSLFGFNLPRSPESAALLDRLRETLVYVVEEDDSTVARHRARQRLSEYGWATQS